MSSSIRCASARKAFQSAGSSVLSWVFMGSLYRVYRDKFGYSPGSHMIAKHLTIRLIYQGMKATDSVALFDDGSRHRESWCGWTFDPKTTQLGWIKWSRITGLRCTVALATCWCRVGRIRLGSRCDWRNKHIRACRQAKCVWGVKICFMQFYWASFGRQTNVINQLFRLSRSNAGCGTIWPKLYIAWNI